MAKENVKKNDKPISREKQFKSQVKKIKIKTYLIDKSIIATAIIVYHGRYKGPNVFPVKFDGIYGLAIKDKNDK